MIDSCIQYREDENHRSNNLEYHNAEIWQEPKKRILMLLSGHAGVQKYIHEPQWEDDPSSRQPVSTVNGSNVYTLKYLP